MNKFKKIAFFGTGGIFSNIVLKQIINKNIFISLVVILVKDDDLVPLNQVFCNENDIDYIKIKNTNTEYVSNILIKKNIDLCLVASYSQIINSNIINASKDGFINLHPSFLPNYRGANPIFWQIKNLNDDFGITVHKIEEKIDSGKILHQKKINLSKISDSNILYRKIAEAGSEILIDVVMSYNFYGELNTPMIHKKNDRKEKGFYNPKPQKSDFEINNFNINLFKLKKMILRMKKWGDAFFVKNMNKIVIESIEQIDSNIKGNSINYIGSKKWRIESTYGSCIVIEKTRS